MRRDEYDISKHRYKELQHWCLQYPEWKKAYNAQLNDIYGKCTDEDPTAKKGITLADYARCISLIEGLAEGTDVLNAVTTGSRPPRGDLIFYHKYRRFFWRLDQEKGI